MKTTGKIAFFSPAEWTIVFGNNDFCSYKLNFERLDVLKEQ